jgi:hypothetical protein
MLSTMGNIGLTLRVTPRSGNPTNSVVLSKSMNRECGMHGFSMLGLRIARRVWTSRRCRRSQLTNYQASRVRQIQSATDHVGVIWSQ